MGENPVSLIVPCHRVLQKSGGLGNEIVHVKCPGINDVACVGDDLDGGVVLGGYKVLAADM